MKDETAFTGEVHMSSISDASALGNALDRLDCDYRVVLAGPRIIFSKIRQNTARGDRPISSNRIVSLARAHNGNLVTTF